MREGGRAGRRGEGGERQGVGEGVRKGQRQRVGKGERAREERR